MKCKNFWKNIISYQEGEVSPPLKEQMDFHLSECANCREELNSSRKITEILHNMDTIKKDEYFWNCLYKDIKGVRISYKIVKENYHPEYFRLGFWDRFLRPALIGFSFGIIIFLSYLYYDFKSEDFINNRINYTSEDIEFYINEHSLAENDDIFSQGGITPLLVSFQENNK